LLFILEKVIGMPQGTQEREAKTIEGMKRVFATRWGKLLTSVALIAAMLLTAMLTHQDIVFANGIESPQIYNEELVTVTDASMVVTWVTDMESDTGILWGPSPEELTYTSGETIQGVYHYMELTDLEPGTEYYYQVCSDDATEPLRSVTTLDPPGDYLFSFATMNDTHIGRNDEASILAAQCVTDIDEYRDIDDDVVAFTIIKGDLTEHGYWDEFQKAKEIYDSLDMPYYPLMGNHDIWPWPPDADEPIGDAYFLVTFGEYLNSLLAEEECLPILHEVPPYNEEGYPYRTYYSFDYDGYIFICIDSVSRDPAPFGYPGATPTGAISADKFA
jgi:hypothetical protein